MTVTTHFGDCREVLPSLGGGWADCCLTDPPYADTSLAWDKRCDGWLERVADALKPAASIWVFGSLRSMGFVFDAMDANGFIYSQDIIWEKQNGTGFHNDRFRRVHEHAALFYRGAWADVYHQAQTTPTARAKQVRRKTRPTHMGVTDNSSYTTEDGGPLLMTSVIYARNEHGRAIHPTQKPVELVLPMLAYACPPGGKVLDCFAGSGTTGIAARIHGCDATLIENDDDHYPAMVRRLRDDAPLFAQGEAA
jgi:site-specific DNA-methyltransferase (adenine-specific)